MGKTMVEIGCGHGDIGAFFSALGAKVTCSDARSRHLRIVRRRHPLVAVQKADMDQPWPFAPCDVVIHLGVLYHLTNIWENLRGACAGCRHLILETEVSDSDDPSFVLKVKEKGFDQAFGGVGSRPSAAAVEAFLKECGMKFERIADDRCNSDMHRYDWPVTNSGKWEHGLRRFWFAEKV
jgi:hypothetical protein